MVIHLWGKFFMAAWRGRRAMTWMTGVIAFLASIGTAFTGYVIQSNFDSQWIASQAKDGMNSVGIGAFFNVLDFGQMLMWHIVLLPARGRSDRRIASADGASARRGPAVGVDAGREPSRRTLREGRHREAARSGPGRTRRRRADRPGPTTWSKSSWSRWSSSRFSSSGWRRCSRRRTRPASPSALGTCRPNDFVATATTELDGTSGTATYGAPYNHNGPGQKLGPLGLQEARRRPIPVDTAHDFVVGPAAGPSPATRAHRRARAINGATPHTNSSGRRPTTTRCRRRRTRSREGPAGDYGPVPIMTARLLELASPARSTARCVNPGSGFYQTNYTKPLLFLADSGYLEDLAAHNTSPATSGA